MLEVVVTVAATTGLFALARSGRDRPIAIDSRLVVELADDGGDLPCPWCMAATSESDDRCPKCRRSFG